MKLKEMIAKCEQVRYADIPDSMLAYDIMCTGNSGRSPLGEAVARDTIRDLGLDDIVIAISSGTDRSIMEGKEPPLQLQYLVLGRALTRNDTLQVYGPEEETVVRALLADRTQTTKKYAEKGSVYEEVREYGSRARVLFTHEEEVFRKKVAEEMGVQTLLKNGGQQTKAHHSVRWCRALAASNEEKVRGMYACTGYRPDITTFGIDNTFGLPYDQYKTMAYGLKSAVETDIQKIAKEVRS